MFGQGEADGGALSLLQKEKRQFQLDFLKAISRTFELEAGAACSEASDLNLG